jgi:hypothetical protein
LSSRLIICALCFVLAACAASAGQERDYLSDIDTSQTILHFLWEGGVSGSLEYRSQCRSPKASPRFPKARALPENWKGSPLDALQEVFAADPRIRVTEDSDGTLRMVDSEAPADLLSVTISHISFGEVYDQLTAQGLILSAPEVKTFMRAHDIEWIPTPANFVSPPRSPSPGMRHISRDLNNVTMRQALDHVSKTFPGFWVYENCSGELRNHVSIQFFLYTPRAATSKKKPS